MQICRYQVHWLIPKRSAFKIQTHRMFLDTDFNSPSTVLATIYQNFVETSMKYYRYMKCMANSRQPQAELLIGKNTRQPQKIVLVMQSIADFLLTWNA